MELSFNRFYEHYLELWKTSNLAELKGTISPEYQAREIAGGKVFDFGYDESIRGWEQGFKFVIENKAKWDLKEVSRISLRDHEVMSILSAQLVIGGQTLETGNLFFQTFAYDFGWKLVRSYIEAGIPIDLMSKAHLTQ
ncbi:flavoprotein [Heyndrickxia sp. MSNUG]|uniref:flavoprotein n=1 Tax=Heyndrickxia sp. MSNUG TaxID=3136677 RepID=UPI003C30E62D